jgi:hypothetical protein
MAALETLPCFDVPLQGWLRERWDGKACPRSGTEKHGGAERAAISSVMSGQFFSFIRTDWKENLATKKSEHKPYTL